jgi:exosortase
MRELTLIKTGSWIKAALYGLLLVGIFYTSHRVMVIWWGNDDYTYCYLIAPIVLYLIWEKREELAKVPARPSWTGFAPLAFGIFLFWLGELAGEFTTMYFASWFVLAGLLWLHLGWEKLKVIWFPIVFLMAMFPPPNFFHFNLTLRLKLISSQIGVWMLHAYGMSAYREGNIIDLGFTQLQVVDACSGLRYLYPLIIMAILLAYSYKSAWWKKVILVLSAIPLTIVTNSLRIAATGVLYEIWGPAVAEDFFHGFSGWLIFIFGLAVLLLEMWILEKIFPEEKFSSFKDAKFKVESETELKAESSTLKADGTIDAGLSIVQTAAKEDAPQASQSLANGSPFKPKTLNLKPAAGSGIKSLLHPPQFVVAVLLLAATLAAAQGIEFREKIPPAKSFASFPTQVGEWTGKRKVMEEKFIKELDLNDYVIVDYQNGGHAVNFYTAYYESQRKGESIHSPETCLPGSGWEFKNAGKAVVQLDGGQGSGVGVQGSAQAEGTGSAGQRADGPTASMTVNKAFMEKGSQKQLSYFWFPQRDRVLTNAWELKLYNFWDALTRQRTDGALVRLITPVYPNEKAAQAEKRLTDFTRLIMPVLNEYLPK